VLFRSGEHQLVQTATERPNPYPHYSVFLKRAKTIEDGKQKKVPLLRSEDSFLVMYVRSAETFIIVPFVDLPESMEFAMCWHDSKSRKDNKYWQYENRWDLIKGM